MTSSPFRNTTAFAGSSAIVRRQSELLHAVHIGRIQILPNGPKRQRAVHRAGIDVSESEASGDAARDGALARARRSIDSDYFAHKLVG